MEEWMRRRKGVGWRDEEDGGMRKGLKQEAETVTVQPSQARSTTGRSR